MTYMQAAKLTPGALLLQFQRLRSWSRTEGRGIASGATWLTLSRSVAMVARGVTMLIVARHLGPYMFGSLSYAVAAASLIGPIGHLGLNAIITRDLVEKPGEAGGILATSLLLRLLGSCAIVILAFWLLGILDTNEPNLRTFVVIILAAEVFRSTQVFSYWLESERRFVSNAVISLCATSAGVIAKLVFVILDAPLVWFVVVYAGEGLVYAFLVVGRFCALRPVSLNMLSPTLNYAKSLLSQSLPLTLSTIGAVANLHLDQVMLGHMHGSQTVGVYAVAARLSEFWYFVPATLVTVLFPMLVEARGRDWRRYQGHLLRLFTLLAWLGVLVALICQVFATSLLPALFGPAYAASATVLTIHVWGGIFMSMRVLASRWLIAEHLTKFSIISHGIGAAVNIVLNFLLIPEFGAVGAAYATLVSYMASGWLCFFAWRHTRAVGLLMAKAMTMPPIYLWNTATGSRVA